MTLFLLKMVLDRRLIHTAFSLRIYSPLAFEECIAGLFGELAVVLRDSMRQR